LASTAMEKNSRGETMVVIPPEDTLEKIINAPIKRRRKVTQTVSVPLEAHQTTYSSDVSIPRTLTL
jgi:hypothetical protein